MPRSRNVFFARLPLTTIERCSIVSPVLSAALIVASGMGFRQKRGRRLAVESLRDVAIVAVHVTTQARALPDRTHGGLTVESLKACLEMSGLKKEDINGFSAPWYGPGDRHGYPGGEWA